MAKSRLLFLIIFSTFYIAAISPPAYSQQFGIDGPEGNIEDWTIIESIYATIYIEKNIGLSNVAKRINVNFARYDPVEKKLFFDQGFSDEERLANKIDIIARKAKKILDMYPSGLHINIRIYANEEKLWDTYEDVFKERKEYRAFYIHKFNTIYISYGNVSESILAHEIGHSIIDNYFDIIPPDKVRELLACYVDVHLKD